MILNKIDDPRDNLEKAHRRELVLFAQAQGVSEITEHMPAILIRRTLRAKGPSVPSWSSAPPAASF